MRKDAFVKGMLLDSHNNLGLCFRSDVKYIPGLQSVKREQMERRTLEMVSAGDQLSLRISKHITPCEFILQ